MFDPMEDGLFDIPDYDHTEDETFPPLPPPHSPGQGAGEEADPFGNGEGEGEGDVSKLAEVPAAKRTGVKRPQPKLDSQRLTSDRGLPALRTLFDNVRFKGKGHEAEDLRLLMQKMENWAHRLYPKLQFEDFIDKVERLGSKKDVQTCLKRIRLDMPLTHDDFIGKDDEEEAASGPQVFGDPEPFGGDGFPDDLQGAVHSTPAPAPAPATPSLTEEQRQRMELNRQRALEKRLARKQQEHSDLSDSQPVSSSADQPTSSPPPSQSKQQDEEEDPDLERGSSMQQPSEAPLKDSELSPDSPQHEKEESSLSSVPPLSNDQEESS